MEELVKANIEAAQAKQKKYWCIIMLQCWQHSIEKGLHKKETKRWKAGLELKPIETMIYTSQICHSTALKLQLNPHHSAVLSIIFN